MVSERSTKNGKKQKNKKTKKQKTKIINFLPMETTMTLINAWNGIARTTQVSCRTVLRTISLTHISNINPCVIAVACGHPHVAAAHATLCFAKRTVVR